MRLTLDRHPLFTSGALLLMRSVLAFVAAWAAGVSLAVEVSLVPIDSAFASNSMNHVAFRQNALKTIGDQQFAAYYDGDGLVTVARRTLGAAQWEVFNTTYTDNNSGLTDDHNVITFGVDGDGYMHLSWGMHNNNLRYIKTTAPVTGGAPIAFGDEIPMVDPQDEGLVTYPQFYDLPGGDLLFMYRTGGSGNGDQQVNRYDNATDAWVPLHRPLFDGEIFGDGLSSKNMYANTVAFDSQGDIHLSWTLRDTPDFQTNQNLYYAKSSDDGATWQRGDGSSYPLPFGETHSGPVVAIPQQSSLINQTSMAVDANDRPVIASWWAPGAQQGNHTRQYMLSYYDGADWQTSQISDRPFEPKQGASTVRDLARPIVMVDDNNRVLTVLRYDQRGDVVTIAHSEDRQNWNFVDLTTEALGDWEPNYDADLWQREQKLNLLYQPVGLGESSSTISVLEWNAGEYLDAFYAPKLSLSVDRFSGEAALVNNTDSPIAVDSLTILSAQSQLAGGQWIGLAEQGAPGWSLQNVGPGLLSEASAEPLVIQPGASIGIGSPFSEGGVVFGSPSTPDVGFSYFSNGQQFDGAVTVTGESPNNLSLVVDPQTGEARLINTSDYAVDIEAYTIVSASGSLLPESGNWRSLDDADTAGGDWAEANPSPTRISELKQSGALTLGGGGFYDLGELFNTSGAEDLVLEFLIAGQSTADRGVVRYQSLEAITPGDFNQDGHVNAADYTMWRDQLNEFAQLPNDKTPGYVSASDYADWVASFGSAGISNDASRPVPEPSGALLCAVALFVTTARRRCRVAVVAAIALGVITPKNAQAQLPAGSWQYRWGDDFAETTLDSLKWSHNYPWGPTHNHDAFMDPNNVVLGDGTLTLVAQRTAQGGKPFTSGAVSTGYNRAAFKSGYIEARIQLPDTPGSWPAFWGLYNGWPPEADIMEYPIGTAGGGGYAQDEYHTAFHYSTGSGNAAGAGKVNPGGIGDLGDQYHTFGMEWREDDWVGFYFDGARVSEFGQDAAIAQMEQMYLILNYAVGGWPGTPSLAEWPARHTDEMKVDYVRVWQPGVERITDWVDAGGVAYNEWDDSARWSNGSADLGGVTARFGDLRGVPEQRIGWSGIRTVSAIELDGATRYRLGFNAGRLVFAGANGGVGATSLHVAAGSTTDHEVRAEVELVGDLRVTNESATPLVFQNRLLGAGGLVVSGPGSVTLAEVVTITGDTVIESGTLALSGTATLDRSPLIRVDSGAVLDVSATATRAYNLGEQMLTGGGVVRGDFRAAVGVVRVGGDGAVGVNTPLLWDEFSDPSLAAYTESRVLDQGTTDNVTFSSPAGVLQTVSQGSDGAEQTLLLRDDVTLGVGQELRVDAKIVATTDRDFGIAVAATADPTELTRSDYVNIFLRSSGSQIGSSGFDGANELSLAQDFSGVVKDTLFIARIDPNTFELGYYADDQRTVVTTRTVSNSDVGSAVGFYSDLRASATISGLDDLRIIDPSNLTSLSETLTFEGNYLQGSDATLQIDLVSPQNHDRLVVTDTLTADGTLEVSLAIDALQPTSGDTFDILDFASASGSFAELRLPALESSLTWDASQLLTTGAIRVVDALPGDYNTDGVVDAADYTVWRDRFGQAAFMLANDVDGGDVGPAQHATWAANYGRTLAAAASVPEPLSACLLALLGFIMLAHDRQRVTRSS